jgi:hypothetical protein
LVGCDWVSVTGLALTGGGVIGGLIGWFLRTRKESRNAEPIVEWDGGNLSITNRINEVVTVERLECSGHLLFDAGAYDDDGHYAPGERAESSPFCPNWTIRPSQTFAVRVRVSGSKKLKVILSSSNGTLRNKSFYSRAR